jgi:hypothetical protein
LIPVWKLKRELQRLKSQISALPLLVYEPVIQLFYDRDFENRVVTRLGNIDLGKQIAVFLIYQPKGLAQSVFLTLDHLIKSGFDPVVVSNCTVLSSDIELLKSKSALIIERRNFGYDFGGYRDAVWLIRKHKPDCEQILFLNDSVWFPVFENTRMLQEMQQAEASYVGTQSFGDTDTNGVFYGFFGSYCFLTKKPLLSSDAFNEYWDNYRMSSNKEVVLRRGERRFSREMLNATDKAVAIYPRESFIRMIAELGTAETSEALEDLIVWDTQMLQQKTELLYTDHRDDTWLINAKNLIMSVSKSKNFIGSSPVISLNRLGFPMIKKNKEMLYITAREKIIDAINSGRISGINTIVEREIRENLYKG